MNFDNLNKVFQDFQNLVTHYQQLNELCAKQANEIRALKEKIPEETAERSRP